MANPIQIGFPIFPGVTQLDFSGPWEVLARVPGAQCHLIAQDLHPVRSDSGLQVLPTTTFALAPKLDVLCLPGGPGHLTAMADTEILRFLDVRAPKCRFITSVCTGAMILAAAGLLRGYRATTHWASLHRLAAFGAHPIADRVVADRDRLTGGGVTAGIDMGLTLAATLADEATARSIALGIEYAPAPPFPGHPTAAKSETVTELEAKLAPYRARMAEADAKALERLGVNS